jgi:choline dehydrogenase-like flavoprotein
MFLDGRSLPNNSFFHADLVIIGAGAAGLTIAGAVANSHLSIILIESGGLEYDETNQDLNHGESVGLPYTDLTYNRLRFFGGTTNHWGGWCRPLDACDFLPRESVKYSGWPLDYAKLAPYYRKAQRIVEAGPYHYDDAETVEHMVGGKLALKGDELTLGMYQYSPPTRFGDAYHTVIQHAQNIKTLLHTNVLEIETTDYANTVTGLRLGCLNGHRHKVHATTYVLAAGGIENARLLLASNAKQEAGLGNRRDLVGRFFMEHPHIVPARLLLTPREKHVLNFMKDAHRDGIHGRPCFRPSASLMAAGGLNTLLILSMHLEFGPDGRPLTPDHPDDDDNDEERMLRAAVSRLGSLSDDGEYGSEPVVEALVEVACEQSPNPLSRITLTGTRDALEMPRVRLDWRVDQSDLDALRQTLVFFGTFMGRNRLGSVRLQSGDRSAWPGPIGYGNHHMGTTRMASDAAHGVVDEHGKVHELDNLYVAGSSVFPTAGAANPTLTIVALALRLADRIQEVML